ncbi:MAG: diadenylate cyclase CdaA [Clostridia bacterium]
MIDNFMITMQNFWNQNIVQYMQTLYQYPIKLISLILDLVIVIFLGYKLIKILKNSRAWQLVKGIALLIIVTALSSILNLKILNFILTSVMTYGVIAIIVIFQPELRRALEQLGTNKFTKFFGIDKDLATKTKEDIYKIVIAAEELAKEKTGALIVIERDIQIKDIIATGVSMESEISPQLLVNIFVPKTPLHDGAVIISGNKIAAAACMLPLAGDNDIAKELGTRHRAAIGISKESDSIAVVVSEETGKISVAKDGTLIADVKEDALKKILITNIVTKRFGDGRTTTAERFRSFKQNMKASRKQAKKETTDKKEEKENKEK